MLATLAIINMAVAAALITDSINDQTVTEPTAIVATAEATTESTDYIHWADEQ